LSAANVRLPANAETDGEVTEPDGEVMLSDDVIDGLIVQEELRSLSQATEIDDVVNPLIETLTLVRAP
jgi:hypothetical protein